MSMRMTSDLHTHGQDDHMYQYSQELEVYSSACNIVLPVLKIGECILEDNGRRS